MPIEVFDFRTDLRNVYVSPKLRGRFLRHEPGEVGPFHSHDVGDELFLILGGQCEFEIDGERAVLGPGQLCVARAGQKHEVRVVGDEPMTMFLVVAPHIEPTHTFWEADGSPRPAQYNLTTADEHDRANEAGAVIELAADCLDRSQPARLGCRPGREDIRQPGRCPRGRRDDREVGSRRELGELPDDARAALRVPGGLEPARRTCLRGVPSHRVLTSMPRLATYLVPGPETRLYQIGSTILGYDVFAGRELPLPAPLVPYADRVRDWVGPAQIYGFHATIGDALELPDDLVTEIENRLATIARETPPFKLINGRIHDRFREFPKALVGTFDSPDRAANRLEERVVTEINALHVGSPEFGKRVASYNTLQRDQLVRYGSPNVRSLFDLHFSLATAVPDIETRQLLCSLFLDELGLFATPDQRTIQVDRVYLLEQGTDRLFRIRQAYDLGKG